MPDCAYCASISSIARWCAPRSRACAPRSRADAERRGSSIAECRAYLQLALRLSTASARGLVITHGFLGSGKARRTQALVELTGAIRIRTDVERKRPHGLAPLTRHGRGGDASEADTEVLKHQVLTAEPLTAYEHASTVSWNADEPLEDNLSAAADVIHQSWLPPQRRSAADFVFRNNPFQVRTHSFR